MGERVKEQPINKGGSRTLTPPEPVSAALPAPDEAPAEKVTDKASASGKGKRAG